MRIRLGIFILLFLAGIPAVLHADDVTQTLLNPFSIVSGYIKARSGTNGLQIPSLSSSGDCLTTDSNGKFLLATCGTGGGGGSSSTPAGITNSLQYKVNGTTFGGSQLFQNSGYLLGQNSTTPGSNLVVQGTSTAPTVPVLTVASSSGASYIIVLPNGNVGIGTAIPTARLEVKGPSLDLDGGSANSAITTYFDKVMFPSVYLQMTQLGAGGSGLVAAGAGAGFDNLGFYNDGGLRMTLASNGNLGIGTSTPQQPLVVNGSTTITSLSTANCDVMASVIGGLYCGTNGGGGGGGSASGTAGSVQFAGSAGAFDSDTTNFFWDNSIKQLQIGPSAGFDGNPQIQLSFSSTVNNFSGIYGQNKSSSTLASTDIILGADNDGVALTGHYVDFGIQGSGWVAAPNFNALSANDGYAFTSGGDMLIGTDGAGGSLLFNAGGLSATATRLTILNTGNVGVNTSTPGATLDIQGKAGVAPFSLTSSTGASLLAVGQNGRLGIGSSTPAYLLTVGDGTGTTAAQGLGFGELQIFRSSANNLTLAANVVNITATLRAASLSLQGAQSGSANFPVTLSNNGNQSYTTGTAGVANIGTNFSPNSGTGIYSNLFLSSNVTQANQTNGITRGLYNNPGLISVYDYRAIETEPEVVVINNANPTSQVMSVLFNPYTYGTSSSTVYTLATSSTVRIAGVPIASTTGKTLLTNSFGLLIDGNAVNASSTNAYGLGVSAPTGATRNFAAVFNGKVGIGTTTPGEALVVQGNVLADAYLEYSPKFEGDALAAIKNIKSLPGTQEGDWAEIDHNSLPEGVRYTAMRTADVQVGTRVEQQCDANGCQDVEVPVYETQQVEFVGRDLGKSVQLDLRAIQQLNAKVEALENASNPVASGLPLAGAALAGAAIGFGVRRKKLTQP